ncbi:hypothetical protein FOVG_18040 [Fusarium oxysporum f. sp. pisi HDV247]|uniref:Alpha/beta hydrolase fold-3 domain-containing protein n=1 Tax=Fusarium oxysporum f. sp. pisi HDV247 TaxID=1080344 RepID=W9ND12_FUSOX|nr:hypothetical protein FOVG_18040 [Fusarium oxysporum f. sp. pisi HDV247]
MTREYAESWLEIEKSLGGIRPVLQGSAEETREQFNGLMQILEPQYPSPTSTVTATDGTFGNIKFCIYSPFEPEHDGPLPLGTYFHPGGFVIGQCLADEVFCRAIAQKTESIIMAIQYRLAPEHKVPCQLEDALAAVKWAHDNAGRIGGDVTKLYVLGASAGAGLAFSVARKVALAQTALEPGAIKGIVALSPYTLHPRFVPEAYKLSHNSYRDNKDNVPMIDAASLSGFFDAANLEQNDRDYFIALDRASHQYLPPTYISACEIDPLRDDGKIMVQSLRDSSVPVKTDHYSGLPHCF